MCASFVLIVVGSHYVCAVLLGQVLIDAGASVEALAGDGWTPLDMAESNGHKEVVRLLVAAGADAD